MRKIALAAVLVTLGSVRAAEATTYDIHVGGICSSQFVGGKGGGYLGNWSSYGETSIDAYIDQSSSMTTATNQLAWYLDTYCTGSNHCYLYTYSNGGALLSRTLALYSTAWNIGYAANAASNGGGSEVSSDVSVFADLFMCSLAGHIGPGDFRSAWNHDDTNGVVIGHVGGNGWLFPYAQSAMLAGHDDGAVSTASAGGSRTSAGQDDLCQGSKYTNSQVWWSCEYGDLNHYDLKMKAICNDGGC